MEFKNNHFIFIWSVKYMYHKKLFQTLLLFCFIARVILIKKVSEYPILRLKMLENAFPRV